MHQGTLVVSVGASYYPKMTAEFWMQTLHQGPELHQSREVPSSAGNQMAKFEGEQLSAMSEDKSWEAS